MISPPRPCDAPIVATLSERVKQHPLYLMALVVPRRDLRSAERSRELVKPSSKKVNDTQVSPKIRGQKTTIANALEPNTII